MADYNSHILYLNGANRQEGDENDWTVFLPQQIVLSDPERKCFRLRVNSANIPFSFTQINANNNLYYVQTTDPIHGDILHTIAADNGNPNITSLNTQIQNAINTQIPINLGITQSPGIVITYDAATGRNTFFYGNSYYSHLIIFNGYTVARMLGIRSSALDLTPVVSQVGNSMVNVNPINSLYLRSDTITPIGQWENIKEKMNISDILCEIPIDLNPGYFISYSGPSFGTRIMGSSLIKFNCYLSTNDNYKLDLQNLDFRISIIIDEVDRPIISQPSLNVSQQYLENPKKYISMKKYNTPNLLQTTG